MQPLGNHRSVIILAQRHAVGELHQPSVHMRRRFRRADGLVDLLHRDDVRLLSQNAIDKPFQLLSIVFFLKAVRVECQEFHTILLFLKRPAQEEGEGEAFFPCKGRGTLTECR